MVEVYKVATLIIELSAHCWVLSSAGSKQKQLHLRTEDAFAIFSKA